MAATITDETVWMTTTNDNYPEIIKAGKDRASSQPLYVGRTKQGKNTYPGKVFRCEDTGYGLYTVYQGKSQFVNEYEMLVTTKPVEWKFHSGGTYPSNAIPGGITEKGETLYIARVNVKNDDKCPGYLEPSYKKCVYEFHGHAMEDSDYEVLAEKS